VRVDSYGFLTFDTGSEASGSVNTTLPTSDTSVPVSIIGVLWREFRLDKDSWVKWKRTDTATLVITWNNAYANNDKTKRTTFQVILKSSGDIIVQVKAHLATDRIYTIGVMNNNRTKATLATYNPATNFIPVGTASNFAVRFTQGFEFFAMSPTSGTVAPGATAAPTLTFNAAGLSAGSTYNGTVTLTTNDPDEANITVPVALTITAAAQPPNAPVSLAASTVSSTSANLTWLDGGAGTTNFVVQSKSGTGSFADLVTLGSGTTSYTATGLTPGSTTTFRVRATNTAGASPYSNEAAVTTTTGFASWISGYPGLGSFTGAGDDPDGDGWSNLLEYAFGGNPSIVDTAIGPVGGLSAGHLQLTFKCDDSRTDILYTVQATSDLNGTWVDIAQSNGGALTGVLNASGATITDTGSGVRTVTVTDAVHTSTTPKRFLRLKVITL
jgi:hypothetical protein